jgi:hypothetical protein
VDCGPDWEWSVIEQAVARGPHKSALEPENLATVHEDIKYQADAGFSRIVLWSELQALRPAKLEISPLTVVPQKDRHGRLILDLSFPVYPERTQANPRPEPVQQGVDATTERLAPDKPVKEIGNAFRRILNLLFEAESDEIVMLSKIDLSDGFWRMLVEALGAWNFCYVMPDPPGSPIRIVVPSALQMGWAESPAYFCVATETACDIIQGLVSAQVELPRHCLEKYMHPTGRLTNSDLEMAALLLHYMVLQQEVDLRFIRVGVWSDNTPTVAWTTRMADRSQGPTAGRLLCGLAAFQRATQARPLTIGHLAGKQNDMSDVASRSFDPALLPDPAFLSHFNTCFPLPQKQSWRLVHPMPEQTLLVTSTLDGKRLPLPQWMTASKRKNWNAWLDLCANSRRDSYLTDCENPIQQQLLLGFATRVRRGYYGRGSHVQAQTPETALRHVAQTLVLDGYPDPRRSYGSKDLDLPFSRLLKCYENDDPAPKPQLALPVRAIQCAVDHYNQKGTHMSAAIADLLTTAFFFLLRPGEYTMPSSRTRTRTVQFCRQDVRFFRNGQVLPHTTPLATVYRQSKERAAR